MSYQLAAAGGVDLLGELGLTFRGRIRRAAQPLPPGLRHQGYLVGVRGLMAERLLSISSLIPPLVAAARARAASLGLDPASVRYESRVTSFTYPGRLMADGLILGHTPDRARAVVFGVFEVKATTDLTKAVHGGSGRPPQLQNHINRVLKEGVVVRRARPEPLPPDQKWYELRFAPGRVSLAPGARAYLATPADVTLTGQDRTALTRISLPVHHLRLTTSLGTRAGAASGTQPDSLTARAGVYHTRRRGAFLRRAGGGGRK